MGRKVWQAACHKFGCDYSVTRSFGDVFVRKVKKDIRGASSPILPAIPAHLVSNPISQTLASWEVQGVRERSLPGPFTCATTASAG